MSEQPDFPDIPQWDVADRMRKSLRVAGVSPGDMATYLNVGGNTVSTWINGRIEPSTQTLRLWALRCGVPLPWLCHGDLRPCDYLPRGIPAGQLPKPGTRNRSNYMQSNSTVLIAQRAAA